MNFNSLKEYFYKLYNACLLRLLFPLGLFLLIYYLSLSGLISPFIQSDWVIDVMLAGYPIVIGVVLTIVHLDSHRLYKINANLVGLGNKLDLFYKVSKRKMNASLWISLFVSSGLLLTGHQWFSLYFISIVFWFFFQWPFPRKASNQLKLKGDEREMVMSKGEAFRF